MLTAPLGAPHAMLEMEPLPGDAGRGSKRPSPSTVTMSLQLDYGNLRDREIGLRPDSGFYAIESGLRHSWHIRFQ